MYYENSDRFEARRIRGRGVLQLHAVIRCHRAATLHTIGRMQSMRRPWSHSTRGGRGQELCSCLVAGANAEKVSAAAAHVI